VLQHRLTEARFRELLTNLANFSDGIGISSRALRSAFTRVVTFRLQCKETHSVEAERGDNEARTRSFKFEISRVFRVLGAAALTTLSTLARFACTRRTSTVVVMMPQKGRMQQIPQGSASVKWPIGALLLCMGSPDVCIRAIIWFHRMKSS
jgi:hypothetical protein